jgi:D-tyrosyl-tRNA(Tyr) deacylase
MSPITIEHHRSAQASCRDCPTAWAAGDHLSVLAVLAQAAEHALETGHTVAEHVADDAVVHPEGAPR